MSKYRDQFLIIHILCLGGENWLGDIFLQTDKYLLLR